MLDEPLIRLIEETSEALELSTAVVEKDYYITQIIHALSHIENDYFQLIFAGGTCLAKAHKIVKRMSEDIDFKIQFKDISRNDSKSYFIKKLKEFRVMILSMLEIPGLKIRTPIVRNEGQYFQVLIDYSSPFSNNSQLRPHILLEFTLANIQLPTEKISIKTMIEDALEKVALFVSSTIQCITIEETAIEKWVSLTRRVIAIDRQYHNDDPTLVRHIYDLITIHHYNRINSRFFNLAKSIVQHDAQQFKNQHPEYTEDPGEEMRQSLNLLKSKILWRKRYDDFIEAMVYDNALARNYDDAMKTLEDISKKVIDTLN